MARWNWGRHPGRNRHVVKLFTAKGHNFTPEMIALALEMEVRQVKRVIQLWTDDGRKSPFIPRNQ